jgi:hypothetical protein
MAQLTTKQRGLLTLTDSLLTQVESSEALDMAAVTGQQGGGMVVSGRDALQAIEYLKWRGYPAALLADRQRYKGNRRRPASQPFDPDWISRQQRLGLAAIIPDAGYIAAGDRHGLRLVLQRSAEIPDAVALLALANWWMYDDGLTLLIAELRAADLPVALVLEHRADPLSVHRILYGVVALLRAGITMLMLRCDPSALGLLANGALAAAYGTRTSIRHLYPVSSGGGGNRKARESALWPAGMALHYCDLLYDAVSASPHDPCWVCSCRVCDGKRLDRLDMAPFQEVRQHNSASLLDIRSEMAGVPAADRPQWWAERCRHAEMAHTAVDAGPVALTCPKSLTLWQQI